MQGLLEMLRVPQSLGFLGGRPNHAIYFVGAQGIVVFRILCAVVESVLMHHGQYGL